MYHRWKTLKIISKSRTSHHSRTVFDSKIEQKLRDLQQKPKQSFANLIAPLLKDVQPPKDRGKVARGQNA